MDLYLSSDEYKDFKIPRKVLHYKKTKLDGRNTLIIQVDKPLIGQKYGLLDKDVTIFYLVNRFNENAFDELNLFPIDVYVLIMKNYETINPSSLYELQNIAWACLYDNEKDAINHRIV